jgi:hypothetical protein
VQIVPSDIADLSVQRPCSTTISRALCDHKFSFVRSKGARVLNDVAITRRREVLQSEIDANGSGTGGQSISDLDEDADIPSPARIFDEATALGS